MKSVLKVHVLEAEWASVIYWVSGMQWLALTNNDKKDNQQTGDKVTDVEGLLRWAMHPAKLQKLLRNGLKNIANSPRCCLWLQIFLALNLIEHPC